MTIGETIFSEKRMYRYTLWREWAEPKPQPSANQFVQFIGLNPSIANETENDPAIRRCIEFAKSWDFGALCMTNLFAFVSTDPEVMKRHPNPIGEDNNEWLVHIGQAAKLTVAAWGKNGQFNDRDVEIRALLKSAGVRLHHLGFNKDGTPKHPLYLKGSTAPTLWV